MILTKPGRVKCEKYRGAYKITFYGKRRTWLGKLFKVDISNEEWVGNCTCWDRLPDIKMAGTSMSSYLYRIWRKRKLKE